MTEAKPGACFRPILLPAASSHTYLRALGGALPFFPFFFSFSPRNSFFLKLFFLITFFTDRFFKMFFLSCTMQRSRNTCSLTPRQPPQCATRPSLCPCHTANTRRCTGPTQEEARAAPQDSGRCRGAPEASKACRPQEAPRQAPQGAQGTFFLLVLKCS